MVISTMQGVVYPCQPVTRPCSGRQSLRHLRELIQEALYGLGAGELVALAVERHAVVLHRYNVHYLTVSVAVGVIRQG